MSHATAVHALRGGGFETELALLDAEAPAGQSVYEPIFFYLIRHSRAVVLFDAGLSSDRIGGSGATTDPRVRLAAEDTDAAVHGLREIDVAPEMVTHVVLSHLHYDHAGGLGAFSAATAVVQSGERRAAREHGAYAPAEFAAHANWLELDGEHDLLGDGAIRLVPTPGHSPGHQSALVVLPGQPVILAGDAGAHPSLLRRGRLPADCHDAEAFASSWARLTALETEQRAVLLGSHDLEFRTSMRRPSEPYC